MSLLPAEPWIPESALRHHEKGQQARSTMMCHANDGDDRGFGKTGLSVSIVAMSHMTKQISFVRTSDVGRKGKNRGT